LFRIGFLAGPKHLILAASKLVGAIYSCTNLPAQKGYAKFLASDHDLQQRNAFAARLDEKRKTIISLFETLPGFKHVVVHPPLGAFYFFPSLSWYIGKRTPSGKVLSDDSSLCLWLLKVAKAVMLPGTCFGKPGRVRIAYAAIGDEDLRDGIAAIGEALELLQ
jgi:aspartate/methionine/tyrosine aminotransferase